MPLSRIKQTSKLLLMEEFCTADDKPDLYTLLRNEDVRLKSEFYSLIEEKLEVRSFEEFVSKFMPSVWEWTETDENGSFRCCYSLEKPSGNQYAHELDLSKNEFYNMVMELYSQKGTSGSSNLDFSYDRVAELLAPQKVMENAKQLRKDLQYNYEKMNKLGEGAKMESNECKKKIIEIRREIVSQYKDSFTGTLKLALADTEQQLAVLSDNQSHGSNGNAEGTGQTKALPCKVSFDENGDIKVEKIEDNNSNSGDESRAAIEDNSNSGDVQDLAIEDNNSSNGSTTKEPENSLVKWISDDYDKYGNHEDYVKNLIVSNYCGNSTKLLEKSELIKKRNQYTEAYKKAQEQFIRAVSSAVEKILDVKVFFEQASINGRKLPAPVIVTNCKASKLMQEDVKEKFEYYISECGKEIDKYRIWFAIVPAIGDADFVDKVSNDSPELDNVDLFEESGDSKVKTQDGDVMVSIESLKQTLAILEKGKITTFFNYRANEKTGFAKFNNDIIEKYREKTSSINGNSYAVFCYPNFTILPKKETAIEIGATGEEEAERSEYLDIPGVYVDSAYVAAGLVVASQNPEYLEKKGYSVNLNNPDVRFDLEEGENRFIMLTNMNRESKAAMDQEVKENIGKDKFGFFFGSDTKYYKGNQVKNTYVYVARNMHKTKGVYDPIYTRLTMDFVMQYLQTENISVGGDNKFKKSVVEDFIKNIVGEWKRKAESTDDKDKDNTILKANEDIILDEDSLKLIFNKTENEIPITIEKDE